MACLDREQAEATTATRCNYYAPPFTLCVHVYNLSKYSDAKILHRQESWDFTKEKLTMKRTGSGHLPLPAATMSLPVLGILIYQSIHWHEFCDGWMGAHFALCFVLTVKHSWRYNFLVKLKLYYITNEDIIQIPEYGCLYVHVRPCSSRKDHCMDHMAWAAKGREGNLPPKKA